MIITDHVYLCFSACLQFDAQFELSSEGAGCRSAAACLFQCLSLPFNYNSLCLFNVNIMLSIMCVRLVFVQLSLHPFLLLHAFLLLFSAFHKQYNLFIVYYAFF